ncbi:MAG: hypothetical protein AAGB51_00035 [Planctomycetota bacterium]
MLCQTQIRTLTQGQLTYAIDNDDFFAGPFTSGFEGYAFSAGDEIYVNGDLNSTTPTSNWDWISPTIGTQLNLPSDRVSKLLYILNEFACPTHKGNIDQNIPYDESESLDFARIQEVFESEPGGILSSSYMAPGYMIDYPLGAGPPAERLTGRRQWNDFKLRWEIDRRFGPFDTPFSAPRRYRWRVSQVGVQASEKAVVLDGSRYYTSGDGLDTDVSTLPGLYGPFSDGGPTFASSRAYARPWITRPGGIVQGDLTNFLLSVRHNRAVNMGFFDGHVELVQEIDLYSNPVPMHPGGSTYTGSQATPEIAAAYETGDVLP